MCYWNLKDGRKLIALDNFNEFDCKPPKIFFYKDGELTPDDDYWERNLKLSSFTLSDFFDLKQLSANSRKTLQEALNKGERPFSFVLPRKGTSISISFNHQEILYELDDVDDDATKQIYYNWINEKWIRVVGSRRLCNELR